MHNFCTYFDKNYLLRGLTLYRSLNQLLPDLEFFTACLDRESYETIAQLNLKNLHPIALSEIEEKYPELRAVKDKRSTIEYYFTLTPVIPLFILEKNPEFPMITYLDADLFFYSHPGPIFSELGQNSILIIPHRFPDQLKHLEKFGLFNVQFIAYRNDTVGKNCLIKYKNQCLEWCHDYLENNKYADQKYLDSWPKEFSKVKILQHKGAGLAPWNWMQYDLKVNKNGRDVSVDGNPLIFYHFHHLKILTPWLIDHGLNDYLHKMSFQLLNFFYQHYMTRLKETGRWITKKTGLKYQLIYSDLRTNVQLFRKILPGFKHGNLMFISSIKVGDDCE